MRNLTQPVQETVATRQYVSDGRYRIELDSVGNVNLSKSFYQYTVTSLPGKQVETKRAMGDALPAAFRAKLKELHQMVISDAEASGLLHPGTDEDDL